MMYRIAMVGPEEAVAGFSLLGVHIHPAHTAEEALKALYALKKATHLDDSGRERQTYAIVFVAEDLIANLSQEDERRLSRGALPAIVPLPSHRGSSGQAVERLRHLVERAVGSDILQ